MSIKGPTHPDSAGRRWLLQLSKAALIDLLLDAMEIVLDASDPDEELVLQLREWAAPRLSIREDRIPKV